MEIENALCVKTLRICRLCLLESECLNNIFHLDANQGIVLWKTVEDLLQIKVSKEDGFPETICGKCLDKLMDFVSFKRECIKSTVTLLNILANKGEVDVQPKCSSSTPNEGINFVRVGTTPMEAISAEDSLYNQDKDPLDVKLDSEVQSFDQEAVSQVNKRDLPVDGLLAVRICSPRVHEKLNESEILFSQVKTEDNDIGSHLNSGDEMPPIKMEPDSQLVPTGYSGDTLREFMENPDSEDLRTSNLNIAKEESFMEPSGTKSSCDTFCDKDQTLNCPPAFLLTTDCNPVAHALAKEDYTDELEMKPNHVHQSCSMPQQTRTPFLEVQSLHPCSSTSSKYPSPSCCSRTEHFQNPNIGSENCEVQEEPELGNGTNSTVQLPVDGLVSSCARILSVPIHLKSRTKSKASGDSHTAYTYPDTKGSSLPSTPGQSNSAPSNDNGGSTECSPNPIRIVRERLQRAAKQQNCSEEKSSPSEGDQPEYEVGIFKCLRCHKVYRNKYFLGQHIRKVHQKAVSNSRAVEGQSEGEKESNRHSGNSSTLKKKLENKARRNEEKQSTGEGLSQKLSKSVISKQPDGLYHCLDCSKVFRRKKSLRIHLDVVHKGLKKQHKCHICGTCVTRKDDLRIHLNRMHGDWVPFPCQKCSSVFGSRKSLVDHERRMHGLRVKPGSMKECTVCKKLFSRNDNLNRHMVVHKKHREFVCEECGKTFREARCMKMHQRRKHQSKKSHQCGHCNKLFVTKFEVQSHVKVHLKE